MDEIYGSRKIISVAISFSRGSHIILIEEIIELIQGFEDGRGKKYTVRVYIDRKNIPGDNFFTKIDENFNKADIIICLITNSFLNNDFIKVVERPIIMNFARQSGKKVIPIIVSRTNNYVKSWMGSITALTLPMLDATKKPYSHYKNKEDAQNKIRKGLNDVFLEFNQNVTLKRSTKTKISKISNYTTIGKLSLTFLVISIIMVVVYNFKNDENKIPKLQTIVGENKGYAPKHFDEILFDDRIKNTNENNIKNFEAKLKELENNNSTNLSAQLCNRYSNIELSFPRELANYPYFGKERYGIYESCQGLNIDGYKPCKKNRKWYIVNEEKSKHILINLDIKTHHKIYAIRPLLNNIAEVYFYEETGMFLSLCVSLEDGKLID